MKFIFSDSKSEIRSYIFLCTNEHFAFGIQCSNLLYDVHNRDIHTYKKCTGVHLVISVIGENVVCKETVFTLLTER